MRLPTVHVYVLGGTITMTADAGSGIAPTLTGEDLMARAPGLSDVARISVHTPFLKPGASLTPAEIGTLAEQIRQRQTAAVVVQGTDTIDETSFLLELLHTDDTPVVVTGAMRGAQALGADGPANLAAAIRTAAARLAWGRGVMVVLNDEIHSAIHVEKTQTGLLHAFQSPNTGPLGYCLEAQPRFLHALPKRHSFAFDGARFGRVAIVKAALGDDDALIRALPNLGYQGVVVEAMGAGHVPEPLAAALATLAQTMPVVLSTRVHAGPIFCRTYHFPGSEMDLIARGLIPAGWLSPHKARLLLGCALGSAMRHDHIRAAFAVFEPDAV